MADRWGGRPRRSNRILNLPKTPSISESVDTPSIQTEKVIHTISDSEPDVVINHGSVKRVETEMELDEGVKETPKKKRGRPKKTKDVDEPAKVTKENTDVDEPAKVTKENTDVDEPAKVTKANKDVIEPSKKKNKGKPKKLATTNPVPDELVKQVEIARDRYYAKKKFQELQNLRNTNKKNDFEYARELNVQKNMMTMESLGIHQLVKELKEKGKAKKVEYDDDGEFEEYDVDEDIKNFISNIGGQLEWLTGAVYLLIKKCGLNFEPPPVADPTTSSSTQF